MPLNRKIEDEKTAPIQVIGELPQGNFGKTLSNFSDADDIAPWAKEAMILLKR